MSLVVCNERPHSPKETACYVLGEIRNEMKVCIIQLCATHPVHGCTTPPAGFRGALLKLDH